MKYSIRKNWIATFDLIVKHPVLILPFVFIAFFETIILEIIYFATRPPLSIVTTPLIKKFFGEAYLHYPAHLVITPGAFYFFQIIIYITAGVVLTAISVNIFNNIKEGLPLKANALIKNALKRYGALMMYGVIIMVLMTFVQPLDKYIFTKAFNLLRRILPGTPQVLGALGFTIFLFLSNFLLQMLFISSIPYMVLEKKPFFKAMLGSISLFFRNIFTMSGLLLLPFLLYLPVVFLKNATGQLAAATFPEVVVIVTFIGSLISIFVDSFMMISVCGFIMDKAKVGGKER